MDISNEDVCNTPSTPQHQHTLLYAVQKCWHSGPNQHVPVDMLRLFLTQREAEEAAYHSAQAFHELHATPNSSFVKTLLLPSYPHHNPQGSSYGFLACGGLFWVRALRATIVAAVDVNSNSNTSGMCQTAAYAILTEGVIGGTGNRNSRRGTEICDGRVFGGDATALMIAQQAVTRVRASLTNPSLRVEAQTVPVGKPAEWLKSKAFLEDWPPQAELGITSDNSMNNDATQGFPFGTTPKRQIGDSQQHQGGWGRSVSEESMLENTNGSSHSEEEPLVVVDCPFEEPIAKRRRVNSMVDESGDNTMMF